METVESVINQSAVMDGSVELEYIICDGGSNDGTVEKIQRLNHPAIMLFSEPDSGMYHALAKGLAKATGDIVSYINAGDLYYHKAFSVIQRIMFDTEIKWLTGINVNFNENSEVTAARLPFRYVRKLILAGEYGRRLPYIQQESTFWSSELNECLDLERLSSYRLAGDYYLWHSFSRSGYELSVVESFLGGFKTHTHQLSSALQNYILEKDRIAPGGWMCSVWAIFELIGWFFPVKLKKRFNRRGLLRFDSGTGEWR